MKENKAEYLLYGIFATVGAIFLIVGIFLTMALTNIENKVDTIGTITEIVRDRIGDNVSYKVFVSYEVDGKDYESMLNSYSSTFYEGKEIEIYYDEDNPNKIGTHSSDLVMWIFPGIGLIFFLIGGLGLVHKIKQKSNEKSLRKTGELIYADYVETTYNTSYQINGKSPYNIICQWNNPSDNKQYVFKSKNIWVNPETIIQKQNIKQFPVYIDKTRTKYIVDVDELSKNIVDLR